MTDIHDTLPPPPEWVSAPAPWASVTPPPWQPPPPPPPASGGDHKTNWLPTVIMVIVGLVVGAVFGSVVSRHGSRPTLSAASNTPSLTTPTIVPGFQTPAAPSAPPANDPATAAVATKVDQSVVDINTTLGYQGGAAAGTGMILSPTGLVLTNNHVIDGSTSITVTSVTSGRKYKATVVGTDPTQDIAVIQLQNASGLTPIPTADSTAVAIGDSVIAIGNAGGVGGTPSVVTGTVQALNQTITASDVGGGNQQTLNNLIQTNTPIQPGDSGGPLVNLAGKVIGVDSAASVGRRFSAGASEGFAIPINDALGIARQIESGQGSATIHIGLPGFLGVAIQPQSGTSGAVVTDVQSGTPAEAAGIQPGDTITSIDGQHVDSAQTLSSLTKAHRPGDKVTVGWTDQSGATHTASVKLASGPAD